MGSRSTAKRRAAIQQNCIITHLENSTVPGKERTKSLRNVISGTEEGHKHRPKPSDRGSRLLGEDNGDRSEANADNDALLVDPSPKKQKIGSTPVMHATSNIKIMPKCSGLNIVKNALQVIRGKAVPLGFCSHKRSQIP